MCKSFQSVQLKRPQSYLIISRWGGCGNLNQNLSIDVTLETSLSFWRANLNNDKKHNLISIWRIFLSDPSPITALPCRSVTMCKNLAAMMQEQNQNRGSGGDSCWQLKLCQHHNQVLWVLLLNQHPQFKYLVKLCYLFGTFSLIVERGHMILKLVDWLKGLSNEV